MTDFLRGYEEGCTLNDLIDDLHTLVSGHMAKLQERLEPRSLSSRVPGTCLDIDFGGVLIADIEDGNSSKVTQDKQCIRAITEYGIVPLLGITIQGHSLERGIEPVTTPISVEGYCKGSRAFKPNFYLGYQDPEAELYTPAEKTSIWIGVKQDEDGVMELEGVTEHYPDALLRSLGGLELKRLGAIADSLILGIAASALLAEGADPAVVLRT